MLLFVVGALLVATLAVSIILLVNALRMEALRKRHLHEEAIWDLATRTQGSLTIEVVAKTLKIDPYRASSLLRGMVDDVDVCMIVDDREAHLKFAFMPLRREKGDIVPRPVGKSDEQRPYRRRTTAKNPKVRT